MALQSLKCPNCNGTLEMSIKDDKEIFCPYCGELFLPEENVITINYNENVKRDIKHSLNLSFGKDKDKDVELLKEQNRFQMERMKTLILIGMLAFLFVFVGIMAAIN